MGRLKRMLQKWLDIAPEKVIEVKYLNNHNAAQFFTESAIQTQLKPHIVGLSYGKHFAKTYTQMYSAHSFDAWDRILQVRAAVGVHYKELKKEYELRITDHERDRYNLNKRCVSKTFKSLDKCLAFKRGLIGKHNTERAARMLPPLDASLFKSKYE